MSRSLVLALVLVLGCKGDSPKESSNVGGSSTGSAAGSSAKTLPAAALDAATAQAPRGAPGLGRSDAAAYQRINTDYRALRKLMSVSADDDRDPTSAEVAAFKRIAGDKKRYQRFSGIADEAGWGDAATAAWIERAVIDARSDILSVIRLSPQLCLGYGSATPSDWVATGCFNPAATFIAPIGETELLDACGKCSALEDDAVDTCREKRCTLVLEGHFNGASRPVPENSSNGPAYEFVVLRARPAAKWSPATLRLAGGAPAPDGPLLDDGPAWGVMWASAFSTDPDPRQKAEAVAAAMVAAGFEKATVVDSRRIPGLWCCSQAVVVDRFASQAEAKALAKKLAAKKLKSIIVRRMAP